MASNTTKKGFLERIYGMQELNKALLTLAFSFAFCFMFLLDYSVPGMSIFYRYSTTSIIGMEHPYLFIIYIALIGLSLFFNLGYARRRYQCTSKLVTALQYIGLAGIILVVLVETDLDRGPRFYIHLAAAIVYAVGNAFSLILLIAFSKRRYPRMKPVFIGGVVFALAAITGFLIHLCGFMETAPMLIAMAVLYLLNYTDVFLAKPQTESIVHSANANASATEKEKLQTK